MNEKIIKTLEKIYTEAYKLNPELTSLVENFKKLDENDKNVVKTMIDSMLSQDKYKKYYRIGNVTYLK